MPIPSSSFIDTVRNELKASLFWLTDGEQNNWSNYHTAKKQAPDSEPIIGNIVADDIYNIMYSSGTTGLPKGIVHSHFVRAMYGSLFANAFRITPESVVMHSGAIIFNGAMLTFMPAMYVGCTFVLLKEFNAQKVIDCIDKERVTHTILVPTQIISCLKYPQFTLQKLSSIEYILSVGAPLLEETKRSFVAKFPRIFYELYGLTEGFMTILDRTVSDLKMGSVGRPPIFMNMKIVDTNGREVPNGTVGEILGNGPLLMSGYYKKPDLTNKAIQNGWLYTGDLGYVDDDGYLFLAGRKKELIISGGVNVYPKDIEEIIIRHPAVQEVAVFGFPHSDWGETPVAAVRLNKPTITAKEIMQWTNDNIEARFQKISDVFIVTDFPKNAAGKIVKSDLLKMYQGC
jgi:long-chain acyl-CoA synthetase